MKSTIIFLLLSLSFAGYSQSLSLDYYLPENTPYDQSIPKPQEVLGFVPGEWHASHDQIVQYMTVLANSSDRIKIENRGFTYEKRPLILLTVTSPENHNNIDDILENRKLLVDDVKDNADYDHIPVVINQGFSVHGNEPSGANAALVYAYYLAAAQGAEIEETLKNTIILLDPSFNPDGIQRFAHWTNSNRSVNVNPDPQDREFDETWPGGRTNHYWFDLNRDWLTVQLPESKARIKTFYDWRPNVLTDHHEMGSNSTFFFQPGIPQRTHPLTPALNQELTEQIGHYHAKALDKIGSLYYSKESFDDFYYGKGSAFPDVNGSVGILFEQASSRGSAQRTVNGVLEFKFTIRNQFTTALSTLNASEDLKNDLLKLQDHFYYNALENAKEEYYVLTNDEDPFRLKELHKVLLQQQIQTYALKENVTLNNKEFKAGKSIVVPLKQLQSKLIRGMFESKTSFKDSIFYDVSAWDLNHAFGVDAEKAKKINKGTALEDVIAIEAPSVTKSNYAYAIRWSDFEAPGLAYQLLNKSLRLKVAQRKFNDGNEEYDLGTLLLPVENQLLNADEIYELVSQLSETKGVKVSSLNTGLTSGINLGSPNMKNVKKPVIALLVGEGVRSYDAGEIWHLLDARLGISVTKIDTRNFSRTNLDPYTHLVIPSSGSSFLNNSSTEKLKDWVRKGGTIIGYRGAINWLKSKNFISFETVSDSVIAENISYNDRRNFYGAKQIGGAIFEAKLDLTHPINYGYTSDKIALFRNTETFIKPHKLSFNNPIQYTTNPLLSGYINKENLEFLKGTVPFQTDNFGRGQVIIFTDNTNFRAFWLGSMKLFMNSIFFSDLM
jgi:hypothetical protein